MADSANEPPVDHANLERKVDQLQRDLTMIKRGVAALMEKLPGDGVYEWKDPHAEYFAWPRRPPKMDNLTWKITRALQLTEQAASDITRAKTKLEALFRRGISF